VRSRDKRIVYTEIWVAILPFQSVLAAFIDIGLNQLSLVTRTHCIAVFPILADRVKVKRGQINYGFSNAEKLT